MTETKKTEEKEEKEVYTDPDTGAETYKDGSPWDQ